MIGVPDATWDEVPKRSSSSARRATTAADLREHCIAHLAKYKVPKHVDVVAALPRNDSGKVLKKQLRAQEAESRS